MTTLSKIILHLFKLQFQLTLLRCETSIVLRLSIPLWLRKAK